MAYAVEWIRQQRETVLDSMGLSINSHKCGRCLVVNVRGNVGAGTAELLDAELRGTLTRDLLLIAVNLTEATLADATALDVLTGMHHRAFVAGKVFMVVEPDPQAYETMRDNGLHRSLLVFATVADFNTWNGTPSTEPDGGCPHVPMSPSRHASRDAAVR
ncbi:MAG: STAS domain-containing protein [Streptosporangiaceae bacterium]